MKTKTMRCVVTDALFPPLSLSLHVTNAVFIRRGVFSPPPPHPHNIPVPFTHNNLRAATPILDTQLSVIGCHIIGWHESSCDNAL